MPKKIEIKKDSTIRMQGETKQIRNVSCTEIKDQQRKNRTLRKRKTGLYKKAAELSKMVQVRLYMAVHDPQLHSIEELELGKFKLEDVQGKLQDKHCNIIQTNMEGLEDQEAKIV